MSTKFDKSRLVRVLKVIERDFKKDFASELNRAIKDVGYRAMQFTGFASPAKIERDLKKQKRIVKQAVAELRASGQKVTKEAIRQKAQKILNVRKSTAKFRRAGWIPGILALGGTIRGATGGVIKPGGAASRGYARKATALKLHGLIANATFGEMSGSNEVKSRSEMQGALRRAVRFVTRDRIKYLRKKYHQKLRKHSDS